jgi:hypothetical protein
MKVAMRIKISGGRGDGTEWPDPGVPFDVDDAEGTHLCAAGLAYPVAELGAPVEVPDGQAAGVEMRDGYDDGGVLPAGVNLAPRPIVNSPKAAWTEYAISQGADPDEAAAMTKAQLIASYGTPA